MRFFFKSFYYIFKIKLIESIFLKKLEILFQSLYTKSGKGNEQSLIVNVALYLAELSLDYLQTLYQCLVLSAKLYCLIKQFEEMLWQ